MKVTTADSYFSKLVRCRAEWCCEFCGRFVPEPDRQALHASHIVKRSRRMTRWLPLNAMSLCAEHHSILEMNPLIHADWVKSKIGQDKYEYLKLMGSKNLALKKQHLKALTKNLKASWEDMQARREAGETGRIEFLDPMPEGIT